MLAALHLADPRLEPLAEIPAREWPETLAFCDRSRLTLALRSCAQSTLPPDVQERLDRNAAGNRQRLGELDRAQACVEEHLEQAGIEFVWLKGPTHGKLFGLPRESRMQYDVDVYCPEARVRAAQNILIAAGYAPSEGMEDFFTDHLPALVRPRPWEWSGDFFDPAIPIAVELHFQFWNGRFERLDAPGSAAFWDRRQSGLLHPVDALGYAALHALKHVLRGSLKPFHLYEIACILHARAADGEFWREWRVLHPDGLRRLETVAFRLAHACFGCSLPALDRLPAAAEAWFTQFALSPLTVPFDSNKDELWLHISLLESRGDAWAIARRRLLPTNLPPREGAAAPANVSKTMLFWRRLAGRLRHHAAALPRALVSGARWWSLQRGRLDRS